MVLEFNLASSGAEHAAHAVRTYRSHKSHLAYPPHTISNRQADRRRAKRRVPSPLARPRPEAAPLGKHTAMMFGIPEGHLPNTLSRKLRHQELLLLTLGDADPDTSPLRGATKTAGMAAS